MMTVGQTQLFIQPWRHAFYNLLRRLCNVLYLSIFLLEGVGEVIICHFKENYVRMILIEGVLHGALAVFK